MSTYVRIRVLDIRSDILLLNHHVKKGKLCLHDGTVTMDLDL